MSTSGLPVGHHVNCCLDFIAILKAPRNTVSPAICSSLLCSNHVHLKEQRNLFHTLTLCMCLNVQCTNTLNALSWDVNAASFRLCESVSSLAQGSELLCNYLQKHFHVPFIYPVHEIFLTHQTLSSLNTPSDVWNTVSLLWAGADCLITRACMCVWMFSRVSYCIVFCLALRWDSPTLCVHMCVRVSVSGMGQFDPTWS